MNCINIFQLTRSRGARRRRCKAYAATSNFNSRAHVERDVHRAHSASPANYFNSRAHVERDSIVYVYGFSSLNFNSRAHVERDRKQLNNFYHNCRFQLTRSRGARPVTFRSLIITTEISTHALTWSATKIKGTFTAEEKFQLTRSRGARPKGRIKNVQKNEFQLTRSRGARRYRILKSWKTSRNFNSRAHVERDSLRYYRQRR